MAYTLSNAEFWGICEGKSVNSVGSVDAVLQERMFLIMEFFKVILYQNGKRVDMGAGECIILLIFERKSREKRLKIEPKTLFEMH